MKRYNWYINLFCVLHDVSTGFLFDEVSKVSRLPMSMICYERFPSLRTLINQRLESTEYSSITIQFNYDLQWV